MQGVRIEEPVSLKWSDIKFDQRSLVIVDESGYAKQNAESRTTKSSRGRYLPIRHELLEVLRSMPKEGKFVFRGPRGGRLKADTVRNFLVRHVIKKLAKRLPKPFPGEKSCEDGRLHSFRHDFCSVCANTGVPETKLVGGATAKSVAPRAESHR
jgi:integrase